MHNAPHDLRDYILDELAPAEKAAIETWLASAPEGRREVERLRLTCGALRTLPDEEPPRRIAFVSDKIFEPSPWARFLRRLQAEGPRFVLGTAAVLAVLFGGVWLTQPTVTANAGGWTLAFRAPAPEPVAEQSAPALDQAALDAKVQQAVEAERERMRQALEQTVAKMIETRAHATEVKFSNELAGAREDLESSLYITNGKYEQLMRALAESSVAEVR
jgi:anti-sigma factor RsiW